MPIVASYCTTFLKPEMLHVYRQVTGLRKYTTFVITRERMNAARFPFADVIELPPVRKNFIKRFVLKHVLRLPPVYYRGELQVLPKALKQRPADLMHIYFGHTGVHLLEFIQEWDNPCIVSFHGVDVSVREGQADYLPRMKALFESVPLVLARSRSLAGRLVALGCPEGKIRINRTPIPLDQFPLVERLAPAEGAWQFVQACRLIEKKGLLTAVRAFARFRKTHPAAQFRIAGEGPMLEDIETLAREVGVADAVKIVVFLSQNELRDLYAESHVFLHPSETTENHDQEGVPNSMLEAMATGLPVVATLHGGIPEVVEEGASGYLVGERDDEALCQAMLRAVEIPARWAQFGAEAAARVREEFDAAKQVARLESFYDEAITPGVPRKSP